MPYPVVFAAISGAHLYGFASATSDVDLRGCHILPLRTMLGLGPIKQEIHRMLTQGEPTVDLVSEDLVRYVVLLLQ
ncbi:MAG: nucleotidyltransferase domain-containing protein [Caldilineales bacterium]|nr:nucleotidyltransferase domain-containing protein [Caldilineales bacterium]